MWHLCASYVLASLYLEGLKELLFGPVGHRIPQNACTRDDLFKSWQTLSLSLGWSGTVVNPWARICLALLTARADPSVADERGLSPAALASNNEATHLQH